jgi:hypothetical protein
MIDSSRKSCSRLDRNTWVAGSGLNTDFKAVCRQRFRSYVSFPFYIFLPGCWICWRRKFNYRIVHLIAASWDRFLISYRKSSFRTGINLSVRTIIKIQGRVESIILSFATDIGCCNGKEEIDSTIRLLWNCRTIVRIDDEVWYVLIRSYRQSSWIAATKRWVTRSAWIGHGASWTSVMIRRSAHVFTHASWSRTASECSWYYIYPWHDRHKG